MNDIFFERTVYVPKERIAEAICNLMKHFSENGNTLKPLGKVFYMDFKF